MLRVDFERVPEDLLGLPCQCLAALRYDVQLLLFSFTAAACLLRNTSASHLREKVPACPRPANSHAPWSAI